MNPPHTPTVEDVAHAAGVSTATVSRTLNQPLSVRPALRAQVLDAVTRLGYVAHAGARALSLRRSGTVGVIVPTVDNAIFARGLQAFQKRMARAGQVVLLAFSDYDALQEETQALALLKRGVDALALTGVEPAAVAAGPAGAARPAMGAHRQLPGAGRCGVRGLSQPRGDRARRALPARSGPPPHRHAGWPWRRQRPRQRSHRRRARGAGGGAAEAAGQRARRGGLHLAGCPRGRTRVARRDAGAHRAGVRQRRARVGRDARMPGAGHRRAAPDVGGGLRRPRTVAPLARRR